LALVVRWLVGLRESPMSRFIEGQDRSQSVLVPEQLEHWITDDVAPVSPDTDSHSTKHCSRRNIRGERILSEECG
jgi:hypothetical protein